MRGAERGRSPPLRRPEPSDRDFRDPYRERPRSPPRGREHLDQDHGYRERDRDRLMRERDFRDAGGRDRFERERERDGKRPRH